jgi:hypothetical protein
MSDTSCVEWCGLEDLDGSLLQRIEAHRIMRELGFQIHHNVSQRIRPAFAFNRPSTQILVRGKRWN